MTLMPGYPSNISTDTMRRKVKSYDQAEVVIANVGWLGAVALVALFIAYNGPSVVAVLGGFLCALGCQSTAWLVRFAIRNGREEWQNALDRRVDSELSDNEFRRRLR